MRLGKCQWLADHPVLFFGGTLLLSSLAACSEATTPVSLEDDSLVEVVSLGMATGGDETAETCPTDLNECSLQLIDDDLHCLCELDGIGVDAGGDPGPQPDVPDLPGWPPSNFSSWPVPPDGGGLSDLEDANSYEHCNPQGIIDSCDYTATLACSSGVTRGEQGGCELTVEPAGALDHVVVWTFNGEETNTFWGADETTWEGTLVESGDVFVEFYAYGRLTEVRSVISVAPRTGSQWSWLSGSGITYNAGGLTFPAGSGAIGTVCHPGQGCGAGQQFFLVQPQTPALAPDWDDVDSGPNEGAWYITNVEADVQMASALNPDWLSNGTPYPSDCVPGGSVSIWDYNHLPNCGDGGSGWGGLFLNWAEEHEDIHANNVEPFINQASHHDLPSSLEAVVRFAEIQVQTHIAYMVEDTGNCVTRAGATHAGHFSHPAPTFDIWSWVHTSETWSVRPADDAWWDPYPIPSACGTPTS